MKYKNVLIDIDNTLLDFCAAEKDAHRNTAKKFNLPWNDELYSAYHKINDNLWKKLELGVYKSSEIVIKRHEDWFELVGVTFDSKTFNEEYVNNLALGKKLMPYANELVKELKQMGLKLFIATNGLKKVQDNRLSGQEFMKYIDGVLISEELGAQKPNVEFFENGAKKMGIDFSKDTVIIGDSLSSDIKGGINYHIDTIWINLFNQENPFGNQITYIVKELKEIPSIIKNAT